MQVGTAGLQPGHCTGKFGLNWPWSPGVLKALSTKGLGWVDGPCEGCVLDCILDLSIASAVVCSLVSGSWPEESQR